MSDLRGQLGFMPVRDLFRYLGNRRLSGSLVVQRGGIEKRVVVHEGAAVSAASTDKREYLGQILINAGLLTAEQFDEAYRTQLETRVPLGQILVMIGLVPEEEIRKALAIKVRETALDLCEWRTGEFEFVSQAPTLQKGVPFAVPLLELCRESEARARTWSAMRRVLPSGATRVEVVAGARSDAPPGSLPARILECAQQRPTIDQIGEALHATDWALYQTLYALVEEGAIRVADGAEPPRPESWFPDPTPPPREEASASELLERARIALQDGAFGEAVDLAVRAIERGADPAAAAVLEEAEGRLLVQLREDLLARTLVPTLVADKGQIRSMPFTPPERYLLARMNGKRKLGAVVRVAPLREVDALRAIKRFAREGLIRFG